MFANASHKEPLRNLKSNASRARKPSKLLLYFSFRVKFLSRRGSTPASTLFYGNRSDSGLIFHNKYIFSNKKHFPC